jgi:hypothetical protein
MGALVMVQRDTAARRVRIATIVVILGAMLLSPERASAQTPPAVTCTTYPSASPWQTIVVDLVDGDCKIDPETEIPLLRTYSGGKAYWDVCNKCGAPVDVKIFGSTPNSLSDLFANFSPMIDASNTSTEKSIPSGQDGYFDGDVNAEANDGYNKYAVAVKFSTEGEGGWDELDPELQIDNNRSEDFLWRIIASLLGAAAGFGAGWWFARRRAAH